MLKLVAIALASSLLLVGCGTAPSDTAFARAQSMEAMFARPPMTLFPF